MPLNQFIKLSHEVPSERQLVLLWQQAMKITGFDRLLFMLLMDHRTIGRKAGPVAALNYPLAWLTQYSANHYERIDPVHHHMFTTKGAFTWDSLKPLNKLTQGQLAILNMAKLAGLNNGIGIPMRGPLGELAAVLAASSTERPPWTAETLAQAEIISDQFYKIYLQLHKKTGINETVQLTDKERQVLMTCAIGGSQADIATKMGISIHGLRFHLRSIFCKLDVREQGVAVMKATSMGLISPTNIGINKEK